MELKDLGITCSSIEQSIHLGCRTEGPEKRRDRVKAQFQKEVYAQIKELYKPNFKNWTRERNFHWKLTGVEANVAANLARRPAGIHELVAPRVQAACFSTIWNRWCTFRRYQQRRSPRNICMLGCEGMAEDSIEHYVHCKAARKVAGSFLRLAHLFPLERQHFLLSAETSRERKSRLRAWRYSFMPPITQLTITDRVAALNMAQHQNRSNNIVVTQ